MKKRIAIFIFFSLFFEQVSVADTYTKSEKITVSSSKNMNIPLSEFVDFFTKLNNESAENIGNPQIHITGGGVKIVSENSKNIVVIQPFRLSYAGSTNAFCKLAVKNLKKNKLDIVSAPTKSELDQCEGLSKPVVVDLNNDSFPDFIFKTQTKSNKGNFEVAQYLVFLSTNTSTELANGSYCYSTSISQFLSEEIPFKATQIYLAIKKENNRRKTEIQKCDLQ
ncbi:MAG: hypothetical protein Q7R66_00665 [Undibacterium sp.]|uniref:hypothetical protein n=1 Tax=Undibacterium sp. TaxID=1914977 RepID=UPI002727DFAE|nr:hypothetical protein [Undibacterium sp.]MDO8650690.1 hypothetical protein [Undibacterium sp.]